MKWTLFYFFIDKITNIIIYNQKSQIRKILQDWGLKRWTMLMVYRFIIGSIVIASVFVFIVSAHGTKMILPEIHASVWLNLVLTLFAIKGVFHSFSFFSKHRFLFYYDMNKMLYQSKSFRVLQVLAGLYGNSLKLTILSSLVMLIPIGLAQYIFNDGVHPIKLFLFIPIYFFLHVILTMTITYFMFQISRFLAITIAKYINHVITFIVLLSVCFLIPYTISNTIFHSHQCKQMVSYLFTHYEKHWVYTDFSLYQLFEMEKWTYGLFFVLLIILVYIVTLFRLKTLKKKDLFSYSEVSQRFGNKKDKELLIQTNYPFLAKDRLHMKRLEAWLLGYSAKTILGMVFFKGFALPAIQKFVPMSGVSIVLWTQIS